MIEINQNKWGDILENEMIEKMSDSYTVQTDVESHKIPGFFSKKGALEMLLMLADGPKTFETLDDIMTVSRSTVSNRLTEASKIGLIGEDTIYLTGDKKVRPYRLGVVGLLCVEIANQCGVSDTFKEWYEARKKHREKLLDFDKEIEDTFDENEKTDTSPEIEALFTDVIKDSTGRTVDVDIQQ